MACDISAGRAEPCKEYVSGIKSVLFINYKRDDIITKDVDGAVTSMTLADGTTPVDAYRWEVREGVSKSSDINASRANGTTVISQVVSAVFKGLSQGDSNNVLLLAKGRPRIIVIDNNDNAWLVGEEFGAEMTAGNMGIGANMEDLYGYSATFTAMERFLPASVTDVASAVNIVEPA